MKDKSLYEAKRQEKKIDQVRFTLENATARANRLMADSKKVSAAYDYVFSLIEKEEKKGVGHLHLLEIEDSINTTSKDLKHNLENALESVHRNKTLLDELLRESVNQIQ